MSFLRGRSEEGDCKSPSVLVVSRFVFQYGTCRSIVTKRLALDDYRFESGQGERFFSSPLSNPLSLGLWDYPALCSVGIRIFFFLLERG